MAILSAIYLSTLRNVESALFEITCEGVTSFDNAFAVKSIIETSSSVSKYVQPSIAIEGNLDAAQLSMVQDDEFFTSFIEFAGEASNIDTMNCEFWLKSTPDPPLGADILFIMSYKERSQEEISDLLELAEVSLTNPANVRVNFDLMGSPEIGMVTSFTIRKLSEQQINISLINGQVVLSGLKENSVLQVSLDLRTWFFVPIINIQSYTDEVGAYFRAFE